MFKNNSNTLRIITATSVILIISIGLMFNAGIGTLSAIGWSDIALLCPLGALGTMLASKLLVPQAILSLVIAVVAIIIVGRAFCAWMCPIPLVQKARNIFKKPQKKIAAASEKNEKDLETSAKDLEKSVKKLETSEKDIKTSEKNLQTSEAAPALDSAEKEAPAVCSSDCSGCASKRKQFDSRHFILGGSLLSAAVFGFPVFCLVCPIGLSFASILLAIRLFSGGDVTISLIVVPLILIIELLIFRKWCHKLCPLSAFMSLFAKANKTFQPRIDNSKCIETTQGKECGLCGKACEEGINPRHPHLGEFGMNECTRCRACVDVCPTKALSTPFLKKSTKNVEILSDSGVQK